MLSRRNNTNKYRKIIDKYQIITNIVLLLLILIGVPEIVSGQTRQRIGGTLSGKVVDSSTRTPIEYATVILFNHRDSTQIGGISTDETGSFQLIRIKLGRYYLKINFLGYEATTIDTISVSSGNREIDLGEISLTQAALVVEGIEVTAEKPSIEYKIDRKVINVSKLPTAISGTAVDILENAPSVSVDIEGNVKLRGSTNFTVLIDGRPSILDANEALEQVPASTIENIEIITNPSAKYDPDGTSGIINVVTKKDELKGISGVINSSGGLDEKYGSDILLNYRNSYYNAFLRLDYKKRSFPGSLIEENQTAINDTISYANSTGNSTRDRTGYGIRSGIDLNITSADNLSLGIRYGGRNGQRESVLDHEEWYDGDIQHEFYSSINETERSGEFYALNMDYLHKFSGKNHELSFQVMYFRRDMEQDQISEIFNNDNVITSGQKTIESGPGKIWRMKLDYSIPIGESGKFESGYQSRLRSSEDITKQYDYNDSIDAYESLPDYSNATEYIRNVHSVYAMLGNETGNLGYQAGIRGEYIYRDITVLGDNRNFNIDRWDYFPTFHVSYQLENNQLMASYARKIKRPRGWWLEPFEFRRDAYNIQRGNPDLKPEYIDAYELGYQRTLGRNMFSVEAYYRITHNKVEFVHSVYDENITLNSVENVGTDYSLGTEIMVNLMPLRLWDINFIGDIYHYRLVGELYGEDFSTDDNTWQMRINNTWTISRKTRLQANSRYNGNSVSAQGTRGGYFSMNAAVKYDLIYRVLSATLQVNDVFSTTKRENTTEGDNLIRYSSFERDSPIVMLNLSYTFNNFKPERDRERDFEDYDEDDF